MRKPLHAATTALALLILSSGLASAMTFELAKLGTEQACKRSCPTVVVASGEIQIDSAEKLLRFIQGSNDKELRRFVVLDSPGGNVIGSLKLAKVLRDSRVVVVVGRVATDGRQSGIVNGGCYSACPYALMGGIKRVVPSGSEVGIHRMSFARGTDDDSSVGRLLGQRRADGDFVDALKEFASSMGVSPDLVAMAEKVGSSGMRILKPGEIKRLRLANDRL